MRRNPPTCRASDAEMEQVVQRWLRFACDRSGGRQRRAVRSSQHADWWNCYSCARQCAGHCKLHSNVNFNITFMVFCLFVALLWLFTSFQFLAVELNCFDLIWLLKYCGNFVSVCLFLCSDCAIMLVDVWLFMPPTLTGAGGMVYMFWVVFASFCPIKPCQHDILKSAEFFRNSALWANE